MWENHKYGLKSLVIVEEVSRHILLVRGYRVMLDSDLAKLYGVPTFRLNEQVKRNRRRFPDDCVPRTLAKEVKGSFAGGAT
jgi:hypothetical protein